MRFAPWGNGYIGIRPRAVEGVSNFNELDTYVLEILLYCEHIFFFLTFY